MYDLWIVPLPARKINELYARTSYILYFCFQKPLTSVITGAPIDFILRKLIQCKHWLKLDIDRYVTSPFFSDGGITISLWFSFGFSYSVKGSNAVWFFAWLPKNDLVEVK
jgi:hypothetical protein